MLEGRPSSRIYFSKLCLDDLGGIPHEILTDRDTAFCIGTTRDGRAILAPKWVDLCATLGIVPRACRPYRAKAKGKVEREDPESVRPVGAALAGGRVPAYLGRTPSCG